MDVDPWGQRRDPGSWAQISLTDLQNNFFHNLAATGQPYTTRGFTGHEMVDEVGIIHMNGRIYDPRLARFLQADPFIQDPTDTQSLNRYAYVRNNPLNATDPSGFFLDHLLSFALDQVIHHVIFKPVYKVLAQNPTLAQFVQIVGTAVSAYFCGPCSIGFNAQFSANVAYAQSGDLKAALRASAIAGASSAAFYGVGQYLSSVAPGNFAGTNLSPAGYASKIALHGIIGGVMSELQGGKFGHGFAAAGVTAAASGLMPIADGGGPTAEGTIIAALVGGTASVISGGKFANGAVTGAFSYVLNGSLSKKKNAQEGTWDPVTNQRIAGLHGDVQGPATDFINQVESELGIQLRVTQGTRTNAEQDALYAQGRTEPGRIVTNARGGESYHNYGLAFDVVEIRNGQAIWNTNWQGISEIGIRSGFEWGGNWTTPDRPHFQKTFGLSIGDLQGGTRP